MGRRPWVGGLRPIVARRPDDFTMSGLTASERRILEFRASGLDRNEIARLLHRSPQTISNSLTIAKEKLGARSLTQAALLLSSAAILLSGSDTTGLQ
jgi:DNA-binding NarL/FixJ family response regulator